MLRAFRKVSMTNVAYMLLLLALAALGMFVYALAAENPLAWIFGAGMVVLMIASVVGFRIGARVRAQSNDSGMEIPGENIWMRPLRREQIDGYLRRYRAVRDNHEQLLQAVAVPGGDATKLMEERADRRVA